MEALEARQRVLETMGFFAQRDQVVAELGPMLCSLILVAMAGIYSI
jgi:hypothetical protein